MAVAVAARQRSFDDLGTPLSGVTFVVIDLETTGGSPATCAITEVGAVKVRGGEILGTFQTLVNPGVPIPPAITVLTGITEQMVVPAPRIEQVLGPLVRFVGDAVIVGHNVRFDLGFLAAAMDRERWPRFANVVVDTCALARRLVRDEVPNCKLETLSRLFRVHHRPTHRALDDALATTEVLHGLLERAGSLGVLGLDDLVALPTVGAHPQLGKLTLATRLPRAPGVYLFRDAGGRPLYVGKAVDLRRRVRSYFTGDERRKVGGLLRELAAIDHIECSSELEASVLEVRLIHELTPRYNQRTKHWRGYRYVKLTLDEPWPRLSVVVQPRHGDGCLYLGPVGSAATARRVAEAIETVVPLRRCSARLAASGPTSPREGACTPAQLGVACCPCSGAVSPDAYREHVRALVAALTDDPMSLLAPLEARLRRLAGQQRYEEAADLRDRAAALSRALERQRRHDAIRHAGRLELELSDGAWAVVDGGVLEAAGRDRGGGDLGPPELGPVEGDPAGGDPAVHRPSLPVDGPGRGTGAPGDPLARHVVDEVATVVAWLEARATRIRVAACDRGLAWPAVRLPAFEPRQPVPDRR